MKTLKQLADLGAAAASAKNKGYHYIGISERSHAWNDDEDARQAFAQAVKDAVMEDLVTNQISPPSKPWTIPPPPEGQQWHRTDWTEEMLPEGYRPLLLEEKDEIGDEMFQHRQWVTVTNPAVHSTAEDWWVPHRTRRPLPTPDLYAALKEARDAGKVIQIKTSDGNWIDTPYPTFSYSSHQYRIKPEPVLVPLDMDDIRATDEFRRGGIATYLALGWDDKIVRIADTYVTYSDLATNYQRRQHGSDEWKPCTKEAQQ